MEWLLLPFIWAFMLLAWLYEKLLQTVHWFIVELETQRKRKENRQKNHETKPPTKEQQRKIEPPGKKPQADDGMNPQERTIPYNQPEQPKQEPERKSLPEFKYTPPQVIIDLTPKKSDKKDRGMQL